MVSERKIVQPEVTSTFKNRYGFYTHTTRDFLRCPKCYYAIYPTSAVRRFDTIIGYPVAYGVLYWGAVEVKNGTKTNLSFSRIESTQRTWYSKNKDKYDCWLWFNIGERIGDKKYPRRTWLIPFSLLLTLEKSLDRKSISPDCKEIREYELRWAGTHQWEIPTGHVLWENIKNMKVKEGVVYEAVG